MLKTIYWGYIFFLIFTSSCKAENREETQPEKPLESILPVHLKDTYKMVWNDEFDGATVNLSKWNYRAEGTVRNYGIVSRQTISLDGKGHVSLKVTKDSNGKYYIGEL